MLAEKRVLIALNVNVVIIMQVIKALASVQASSTKIYWTLSTD